MTNVLIIDDEINICKLIYRLIEWEKYGLQCAGMAQSGMEALEIARCGNVDIVITDIRMDGMEGLELIERMQKERLARKFIIVSGYKSFQYAYSAIKFGVMDFLLKPINKEELNLTLEHVLYSIESEKEGAALKEELKMNAAVRLRKQFILNIIHKDMRLREAGMVAVNKEYYYSFSEGIYQICILQFDRSYGASHMDNSIYQQVISLFDLQMNNTCYEYELVSRENDVIILINYSEEEAALVRRNLSLFSESALLAVKRLPFLSLTIGFGRPVHELRQIYASYRLANLAVMSRYMEGADQIIWGENLNMEREELPPNSKRREMFRGAIETMDRKAVADLYRQAWITSSGYLERYPYQFMAWMKELIADLFESMEAVFQQPVERDRQKAIWAILRQGGTGEALHTAVGEKMEELMDAYEEAFEQKNIKIIGLAKKYIEENYRSRLSLEDVSEQVFLSPAYFGILFKKETKMNFTDYVTEVRVEKAKALLKDVRYHVSEIAELVGYKDAKYFGKIFQKQVGLKPSEYRKIHQYNRGRKQG